MNTPQVTGLLQEAARIAGCPDRSPSVPTPRLPLFRQDDNTLAPTRLLKGQHRRRGDPQLLTPEWEVARLPEPGSKVGAGFPTVAQFPRPAEHLIAFVLISRRTLALTGCSCKPELSLPFYSFSHMHSLSRGYLLSRLWGLNQKGKPGAGSGSLTYAPQPHNANSALRETIAAHP